MPKCNHHVVNKNLVNCDKVKNNRSRGNVCPRKCTGRGLVGNKYFTADYYKVTEESDSLELRKIKIKHEIMEKGSVGCSFDVYDNFMSYKSGIFSSDTKTQIISGHAMRMIGWGSENG